MISPVYALDLVGNNWHYHLKDHSILVHDPEKSMDVSGAITTAMDSSINHPDKVKIDGISYWQILPINNVSAPENLALYRSNNVFPFVDVYLVQQGKIIFHQATGAANRASQANASVDINDLIPLHIPQGTNVTLAIRYESPLLRNLATTLSPLAQASQIHSSMSAASYLLFGAIIALTLYNLSLTVTLRDWAYGWYSLHAIFYVVFYSSAFGITPRLFLVEDANFLLHMNAMTCVRIFGLLFIYQFLRLAEISRKLQLFVGFFITFNILQLLAVPFIPLILATQIGQISHLLLPIIALIPAIIAWRRGFLPARYVIFGWAIVGAVNTWGVLTLVGVFSLSEYVPIISLTAVLIEMVALSFALSDRIKCLEMDKTRAEVQNQYNSAFIATLSHEIRNPLSGMLGITEILRRTHLNKQQSEYIETLNYSTHSLLDLLNNLLDYSKHEQNHKKIQLSDEPFEIKRLLESISLIYTARAREKHSTIQIYIAPEVPDNLIGDSTRLRQVMINLVSNAVKFTQQGSISIQVELIKQDNTECTLNFLVTDTGDGIAQENIERIFEPYIQLPGANTQDLGTGLGLPICKSIINEMGGDIAVKSKVGQGSQFYFHATFKLGNNTKETSAPIHHPKPTSLNILIVDDEPLNLKVTSSLLELQEHNVTQAQSGQDALELIKQHSFDLVLLDMQMPNMNGIETCQHIRKLTDPEKSNLPVIAYTANTLESAHQDYLQGGVDYVLSKPLNIEAFIAQVSPFLKYDESNQITNHADPQTDPLKVLDFDLLNRNRKLLSDAVLLNIIQEFEKQTSAYMNDMQQLIASSNIDESAKKAHLFAGSASALGLQILQAKCLELESKLKQMNSQEKETAIKQLSDTYKNALQALKNYRYELESTTSKTVNYGKSSKSRVISKT